MAIVLSRDGTETITWAQWITDYRRELIQNITLKAVYDRVAEIINNNYFVLYCHKNPNLEYYTVSAFPIDTTQDEVYVDNRNQGVESNTLSFWLDTHGYGDTFYRVEIYENGIQIRSGQNIYPRDGNYTYNGIKSTTFAASTPVTDVLAYCEVAPNQTLYINEDPVLTYNLHSLKETNGVDATLHYTQLVDQALNNGNPVSLQDQSGLLDRDLRSSMRDVFSMGSTSSVERLLVTTYQDGDDYMRLLARHIPGSTPSHAGTTYLVGEYKIGSEYSSFPITLLNDYTGTYCYLGMLVDDDAELASPTVIYLHDTLPISMSFNGAIGSITSGVVVPSQFLSNTVLSHYLWLILNGQKKTNPDDPYSNLPEGIIDGGDGDHNYIDDPNDNTPIPGNMTTNLGFVTMFAPSESQIKSLAEKMWTDSIFDLDNFRKMFADPMDCILALLVYPFHVPATSVKEIVVGNISSGVQAYLCNQEFIDIDMGSQYIDSQLKSFLDYEPYSKLEVYLPFCGVQKLNNDKYIGKTINVSYRVHLLTGACTITLKDVTVVNGTQKNQVLAQFSGNMAMQVPLTSLDYSNCINTAARVVGGLFQTGLGLATGNPSMIGRGVSNAVSTIGNAKGPNIENSGGMSGNAGVTGLLRPYFIETCPRLVYDSMKNELIGTPAQLPATLGTLSGYCQITGLHISSNIATHEELEEIERLLEEGVIFNDHNTVQ